MINYANYFGGSTFFFAPGMGRVSPKLVGQNNNAPALLPLVFDRSLKQVFIISLIVVVVNHLLVR